MYFQIAVNIDRFGVYHIICFCMYLCVLLLSMTLFFVTLSPCQVIVVIAIFYLCQFFDPSVFLCKVSSFTFIEKSDCDKINLILCVISITTMSIMLLQMILGYIYSFVICLSVSMFGIYTFLMIMVLCFKHLA